MAKFIVFYQELLNGEIDECVGGDSALKVDGRLSINTIIDRIYDRYYYRPKSAIGFKIHVGTSHLNNKPITKLYRFDNGL